MDEPASTAPAPADSPRGKRPRPSRPHVIKFRVSDEEYALLKAKARQANTDMTAMLRDHIHRARIRPADDVHCLAMLTRIHRNVEALQQWAKTYGQGADAVSIMAHLVAVEREIDRVRAALARSTHEGFGPARQQL